MCDDKKDCIQTSFLSFTKEFVKKGTKEFVGEFQFNSGEFHPNEALIFTKSIDYGMKKLKDSTTVQKAIEELSEFQSSLRK